jgi:hypothetical protein
VSYYFKLKIEQNKNKNMNDSIKIKKLVVTIQENGIVRNSEGRIIARFVKDIEFYGEHIVEEKMISLKDVGNIVRKAFSDNYSPNSTVSQRIMDADVENWIKENLKQ